MHRSRTVNEPSVRLHPIFPTKIVRPPIRLAFALLTASALVRPHRRAVFPTDRPPVARPTARPYVRTFVRSTAASRIRANVLKTAHVFD